MHIIQHHQDESKKVTIADLLSARIANIIPLKKKKDTSEYSPFEYNFESNQEFIQELIDDPYLTCCPKIKSWIEEDKAKTKQQEMPPDEEFNVELLKKLDENLRYDIIEFIPTFSKFVSRGEDNYLQDIKFPHSFDRPNRIDQPLTIFHKMRIISKHFNRRMMKKILTTENLFIHHGVNYGYIITLLREQRKFSINGYVPNEALYLYQDIQIYLENNGSNLGDNVYSQACGRRRPKKQKKPSKYDGGEFSSEFELIEYQPSSASSQNSSSSEDDVDYSQFKFERRSIITTFYPSNSFVSEFIGENTTVKKLIFSSDIDYGLLKACTKTKTLICFEPRQVSSNKLNEDIENVVVIDANGTDLQLQSNTKTHFDIYSIQNEKSWSSTSQNVKYHNLVGVVNVIKDHFDYFGPSTLQWLTEMKFFTEIANSLETLGSKEREKLVRDLFDYCFVIGKVPIEWFNFTRDEQGFGAWFQYLVYIANTYQNGGLFGLKGEKLGAHQFNDAVKYGWDVSKRLFEIPYLAHYDIFSRFSSLVSDEYFYSFACHSYFTDKSLFIDVKVSEMLSQNRDSLFKLLSKQITNRKSTIPMIVCVINSPPLFDILLEEMRNEDYAWFTITERGDSIFHIFASFCLARHVPKFLSILTQNPSFVHLQNSNGKTPFDLLTPVLDPTYRVYIEIFLKKFNNKIDEKVKKLFTTTHLNL